MKCLYSTGSPWCSRVAVNLNRKKTLNKQLKFAEIVSATSLRHQKKPNKVLLMNNDDKCGTHGSPAQDVLGDVRSFRSIPLDGVRVWLICALCDDHLDRSSWPWKKELPVLTYWGCCGVIKKQESCMAHNNVSAHIMSLMPHCYLENQWIRINSVGELMCTAWVHFL